MPRRVLLVDDDEDLRSLCQLWLEAQGSFTVICAGSAEEAVEVAAGQPLDLALIDLCMPGLDGTATLARLRALPEAATVPAVLMTAAAGEAPIARPEDWAAIIHKPFDLHQLAAQLLRVVDQHPERGVPCRED